jgi:hypothetical protein
MNSTYGFTDTDLKQLIEAENARLKKSNKPAYELTAELLNQLVLEMLKRAEQESRRQGDDGRIGLSHLEKVLPQILLDFF